MSPSKRTNRNWELGIGNPGWPGRGWESGISLSSKFYHLSSSTFIQIKKAMDIFLIILWFLCMLLALGGVVLPVIPGPALWFFWLVLLQFTSPHPLSLSFFLIRGGIMLLLTILDYVIPIRWTKTFGGTKRGVRGSMIGLVIAVVILPLLGIVLGPFGILGLIAWPFLGAYVGERLWGRLHHHALRAATGSFVGFLAGTAIKLVVCVIMLVYFCINAYAVLKG